MAGTAKEQPQDLPPGPARWSLDTLTPQRIRLDCLKVAAELRTGITTPGQIIGVAKEFEKFVNSGATGDGPADGGQSG